MIGAIFVSGGKVPRHHIPAAGLVLLLPLLLIAGSAIAETELTPHRATYKVKIGVLRGEMKSSLELLDGKYLASSTVKPKGIARIIARGSILEKSQFEIVNGRIRPSNYSSLDTLSKNSGDIQNVIHLGNEFSGR